jgi:hypothetical protein
LIHVVKSFQDYHVVTKLQNVSSQEVSRISGLLPLHLSVPNIDLDHRLKRVPLQIPTRMRNTQAIRSLVVLRHLTCISPATEETPVNHQSAQPRSMPSRYMSMAISNLSPQLPRPIGKPLTISNIRQRCSPDATAWVLMYRNPCMQLWSTSTVTRHSEKSHTQLQLSTFSIHQILNTSLRIVTQQAGHMITLPWDTGILGKRMIFMELWLGLGLSLKPQGWIEE